MEFHFSCDGCESGNTEYEWIESVGFDVHCNDCGFNERQLVNDGQHSIDINALAINVHGTRVLINNLERFKLYNKLGRNDKCACDSGKKFKKCCININWEKL